MPSASTTASTPAKATSAKATSAKATSAKAPSAKASPADASAANASPANASPANASPAGETQWPLWEVFTQEAAGAPHQHAGSVHAVDAEQALQNARDVYARRNEAVSIWVVPTITIRASTPEDVGPFFDPANDKAYRHPQFYRTPRGVRVF